MPEQKLAIIYRAIILKTYNVAGLNS